MRAKINGSEVYLKDDQAPAFSLSINSLLDPSKVKGISSTTIRGISTKELRRLGYTEHMRSVDRPDIGVIRIGEGGVDYFTGGIRPASTNRNETEFIAVGGNASWFEYAKNTKIRDLDLGTSPIIDATYQRGTWIDEEDILCFPLADFGSFFNQPNTHDVAIEKLRPGLRAHRVLDIALEDVGFTIRPRGTLASHWKKFVHFDPAAEVQSISGDTNNDSSVVRPAAGGTQTVTTTPILSAPGWLNTQEVHDPNDRFNGPSIASAERYLVPFDTLLSVRLRGLTISDIPSGLNGTQLRIVLYEKTQNIPLASILTTTLVTAGSVTINEDFPDTYVEEGWEINVGYWNSTAGNEDVTVSDSAARILFIPATRPYAADCQLVINTCAKDFTVADLLKSIASDQFLVFNTNSATRKIDLWYEREFFREPTPAAETRDWTDRMDHTKSPAKVYDDVALELHYRWKEDGSDLALRRQTALLASPGYGNADLVIGGYSPTQTTTIPYAPTAMGFVMGGLRVPILRDAKAAVGEDEYQRIARLLYFDGVVDGEWTHDGDTLTEYPKCYFVWDATGHPIAFGNARVYGDESENQTVGTYGDRMALRLRTSRILQCYLRLRDHELQDFDHGMPTLIDDGSGPAWYYVQEISQHQFGTGKPTKCTLVQIPGKRVSLNPNTVVAPFPVPVTPVTPPPIPGYLGFNLTASAVQFVSGDGIIVGGQFTTYGLTTVGYFVKLNSDGSLNSTFTSNSGTGFNNAVVDIKIQSDGKIVCCGLFTAYNGNSCGGIARINADGTFDSSFNAGGAGIGTPSANYTGGLEILADGTIIMVGVFTVFNGVSGKGYIVALDSTGAVSTTFLTGTGFSNLCYNIKKDLAGKVVITGIFGSYKGVSTSNVIRLNSVGTKDTSLVWPTTTPNGSSLALTGIGMQADGKILLAGNITQYGGVTVPGVIRIANDGTLDTAFNTNLIAGGDIPASPGVVKYFADGRIFVCGKGMVALDSDGTTSSTQYITSITSTSAVIYDIAIRNDGLAAVVGSFVTINGSTALRIFSFNIGSFSDFNNDFNDDFNNGG